MKSKITLYSHYFWPSLGGVERFNIQLLEKLKEFYDVSVITKTKLNKKDNTDKFEYEVERTNKLSFFNKPNTDLLIISGYSLKIVIFSWLWRIPSIVIHHGDIVNCSNGTGLHGNLHCQHIKINCFKYDLKEFGILISTKKQLNLMMKKLVSSLPTKHIFVSKWVKNITHLKGDVIYNCFDKSFLKSKNTIQKNQIVFAGRLTKIKGCESLIKAYSKADINLKLIICGDGEEKTKLEILTRELNLRDKINFTGILNKTDLSKIMSESKYCVIPTIIEEPFGLVAIESAAANCIVIGSNRGGLKEVCEKIGYTYDTEEELIILLKKASNNSLNNLSSNVSFFNCEKMFNQYISTIDKILKTNNEN